MAAPVASMREAGIRLPSKGSPVNGSNTVTPLAEKSPARSAAVGTFARRVSAVRS